MVFLDRENSAIMLWEVESETARAVARFEGKYCQTPTWSPDGTKVAFQVGMRKEWDLWTVVVDGSDSRYLVDPRMVQR
jgi:Tol biopolymer transport system component